jgi:hypothetical protein
VLTTDIVIPHARGPFVRYECSACGRTIQEGVECDLVAERTARSDTSAKMRRCTLCKQFCA